MKYTDAWCSTFASAVAIAAGLTDIIPTECGCEKHIALFKKLGAWVENDAYVPKPGDYIFYDWQDGTNYATTRTHTVVRGDTLWALASTYLGSGSRYKEIMRLNGLTSEIIHVGQVLKMPAK